MTLTVHPDAIAAPLSDPAVQRLSDGLRREVSVTAVGPRAFAVVGYRAAEEILRSRSFVPDSNPNAAAGAWNELGSRFFIFASGEDHVRIRRIVARGLSPRAVHGSSARTIAALSACLEPAPGRELKRFDAVQHISVAASSAALSTLIGLDPSDSKQLERWATRLPGAVHGLTRGPEVFDEIAQEISHFASSAMSRPAVQGILGSLQQALSAGELSTPEAEAALSLLLVAGFETSANFTSNSIDFLLREPAAIAHIVSKEDAAAAADELLRLFTPAHAVARIALEPRTIAGCQIPQGSRVMVLLSMCNRDPGVFEAPDHYVPSRIGPGHLSFAAGPHYCVGAPLARHQATEVVMALAQCGSRLRRDHEHQPQWYPRMLGRGIGCLPVVLSHRHDSRTCQG